jgi:CHAD domain-containing protein
MPPSSPASDLQAFLADGIAQRARRARKQLEALRERPDRENTHALSTLLRRLLTISFVMRRLYGRKILKGHRREIRAFRKVLGGARDCQEMLEKVRGLEIDCPFVTSLARSLAARERASRRRVAGAVDDFPAGFLEKLSRRGHCRKLAEGTPAETVPELLRSLLADVLGWEEQAIGREDDAALHRMRVSYKRYRYAVELFAPDWSGASPEHLKHLRTLQEAMGQAHDWMVLEETARDYARRRGRTKACTTLQRIHEIREEAHAEARDYLRRELDILARAAILREANGTPSRAK